MAGVLLTVSSYKCKTVLKSKQVPFECIDGLYPVCLMTFCLSFVKCNVASKFKNVAVDYGVQYQKIEIGPNSLQISIYLKLGWSQSCFFLSFSLLSSAQQLPPRLVGDYGCCLLTPDSRFSPYTSPIEAPPVCFSICCSPVHSISV